MGGWRWVADHLIDDKKKIRDPYKIVATDESRTWVDLPRSTLSGSERRRHTEMLHAAAWPLHMQLAFPHSREPNEHGEYSCFLMGEDR